MSLVAGALCLDGSWSPESIAARLAQRSARYAYLSTRKLYSDGGLALFAVFRSNREATIQTLGEPDGDQSWILGDLNYFVGAPSITRVDLKDPHAHLHKKLAGRWVLIQRDARSNRTRITTDRLGLMWLYIGQVGGGIVFASDFGAVAEEIDCALTVNREALLCELGAGYSPGNATVFNEISLVPPAATIELGESGFRVVGRATIEYGDQYAGLSRNAKFRLLDEIYEVTYGEIARLAEMQVTLSISAGNDSRYALAHLDKLGVDMRLLTFGHPNSLEVLRATEVCSSIARTNEVFPVPQSDWDAWARIMNQLGNAGMVQWAGWPERWMEYLRARGNTVVVGNFGDALSGKFLSGARADMPDWIKFWNDYCTSGGWQFSPLLRSTAREQMAEALTENMKADLRGAQYAFPYQTALHLNLYGRQRRWTGSQPNLLGRAVLPILPFFRERVIDFWTNLPMADLGGQKLYLDYARARFPVLFPAARGPISQFAQRALRKLERIGRRLIGGKPGNAIPPIVINRHQAVEPNKHRIVDLAQSVKPLVDDLIDIDGLCKQVLQFDSRDQEVSGHVIRAANLFFLLSLKK